MRGKERYVALSGNQTYKKTLAFGGSTLNML